MALFKSYAQSATYSGYTVKVSYADVAGGYAGWFVTRVQGQKISDADSNSNPADGPSFAGYAASEGVLDGSPWFTPGGYEDRYGRPLVEQVNSRLNAMFGVGHSAKWTATIVQEVTPAVVNDDWGTP